MLARESSEECTCRTGKESERGREGGHQKYMRGLETKGERKASSNGSPRVESRGFLAAAFGGWFSNLGGRSKRGCVRDLGPIWLEELFINGMVKNILSILITAK